MSVSNVNRQIINDLKIIKERINDGHLLEAMFYVGCVIDEVLEKEERYQVWKHRKQKQQQGLASLRKKEKKLRLIKLKKRKPKGSFNTPFGKKVEVNRSLISNL